MAKTPAAGPGPNTATKSSAQTSELTDRDETRTSWASVLSARDRHTLRAAISAKGRASAMPRIVPSVAMCSVSTSAACTPTG
jgi:hypothetical protein